MKQSLAIPGVKLSLYSVGLLLLLVLALFVRDPPDFMDSRTRTPPIAVDGATSEAPTETVTPAAVRTAPTLGFGLIIPVANVTTDQLHDTWGAARSEGRSHQGIDIMAPQGTPVLAAVDGRIEKFFESERGGITIYQFDETERYVFYYGHLSARHPSLREGDVVRQGDVIAYVGSTGNATTPHLHFEIQRMTSEKKWWQAAAVNPYQFLVAGLAP